jgi:hypothetical protein
MSTELNFDKKVVWAAVEATYKTDPGLTAAVSGIEARNVSISVKSKRVEQNIDQPYLGDLRELVVGTEVQIKFEIAVAGSGAAGTAPAYGKLNRACKRSETILAVAVAGNATAGGAGSLTLAAGASVTDDVYRNMQIRATGGTGSGQTAIIKSYNGTTKVATFYENVTTPFDATTVYSIDAQTVYAPVDEGDDSDTFYYYNDRLKFIILGARGNMSYTLDPLKIALFSYTFTGLWGGYSDVVAMPADTVYTAWKTPLGVNATNTIGFKLHGFTTNMYNYSIDDGHTVSHRDDIVGVEDVVIAARKSTGSVTIQKPLKAEHDFYAAAQGTGNNGKPIEGSMTVQHGTVAGEIVIFYQPAVTVGDPQDEKKSGGVTAIKMALGIKPVAPGGNDSIIIVK